MSPQTQRLLDERLKAGTYASPDDALREGLLLLEHREREHEAAFRELKAKLERGAAQAERGELVDGEAYFDRLLDRLGNRADGKADKPDAA